MLEYEVAEVKEYFRENSKGEKSPYYQIRFKKKSKFNGFKTIALVDVEEIEEIVKNADSTKLNELQAKLNASSEEKDSIQQELKQIKATNESLASEVEELKSKNSKLQEDLLAEKEKYEDLVNKTNDKTDNANKNVFEAMAKIEDLQKEHKTEIKELNSKIENEKDISKTLLLALYSYEERSFINGLFNKTPDLAKQILKENPKPIEVKASKTSKE